MIGPTFGSELEAAGLAGLPFAWGSDGEITYGEAITSEQRIAIEAVLAAHNPQAKPVNPRQQRQARIDAVTDLDSLKTLLKELL